MDYKEFLDQIMSELEQAKEHLGVERFDLKRTTKNNQKELDGVQIFYEQMENIAPVVYLNEFYDAYQSGEITMQEISRNIQNTIRSLGERMDLPFSLADLTPENAREHLVLQLINKDWNRDRMEQCACMELQEMIVQLKEEKYKLKEELLNKHFDFDKDECLDRAIQWLIKNAILMKHVVEKYLEQSCNTMSEQTDNLETIVYSGKEGNQKQYYVTKYERNPENRKEAIHIHGYACQVCGFDFEKVYGELGKEYIEVHHIKPLYSLDEETIVNPETDLICVCSNCHRMLHRKRV